MNNKRKISAIRRRMLGWYQNNKRDLPWRKRRDAYSVWVSEIMLQQTRVETVVDYYTRFMLAFPTIHSLARAREDAVLKCWEGLGYYSRALNLHRAAKTIVNRYHGRFPNSLDELMRLPGVGRYTAGAIASIAFGITAPVLDGNVKRVLARIYAIEDSIDASSATNRLWELAGNLVSPDSPGDFNQSLMELGARVCLPKSPLCRECPIQPQCESYRLNLQTVIPQRKPKKKVPHYEVVAAAIYKNGRYLLGKRPPGGMLGGLWEFPGGKIENGETHEQALVREIHEEMGIGIEVGPHIATVHHAYSHYTVSLHLYRCTHTSGSPRTIYHSAVKWVPRSQFERYTFPTANHKLIEKM